MERIVGRYRNLTILGVVLFAQVLGLAVQIYRPAPNGGSARLIRVWTTAAISPMERAVVGAQQGLAYVWKNYFYLRGVRTENEGLRLQLEQMRIQQVRLREDAVQAHRLQVILQFKEQFVAQTIAAQVIGTSGSEHSRLLYIDKGSSEGLKADMAVVTPDGVVGKVIRADKNTSTVLLINDEEGGVGALLEKSRLQGIVRGTPNGTLILHNIMNDEKVEPGELVLASGGDRVFPKGMPIGRVKTVRNGADVFFDIEITPAADLNRLEEVLVITRLVDREPPVETAGPVRAADMLAERLPSVPPPPPTGPDGKPLPAATAGAPGGAATPNRSAEPATPAKPGAAPGANLLGSATQAARSPVTAITTGVANAAPGVKKIAPLNNAAGVSATSSAVRAPIIAPVNSTPNKGTSNQQPDNVSDSQSNAAGATTRKPALKPATQTPAPLGGQNPAQSGPAAMPSKKPEQPSQPPVAEPPAGVLR